MFRETNFIYISTLDAELPFDLWPQMPDDIPITISPGQVALAGGWKIGCERWHLPARRGTG
jgi:hypothetical protein